MDRFHNLTELLAIDHSAHAYFHSLPAHIRQQITARSANVHSARELQGYAEHLLRRND